MARLQNIFSCELTWLSVSTISNRNWSLHIPTQIISIYLVKEPGDRFRFILLSRCILQHFKSLSNLFFRSLQDKNKHPSNRNNKLKTQPKHLTPNYTFKARKQIPSTPKSRQFYFKSKPSQDFILNTSITAY